MISFATEIFELVTAVFVLVATSHAVKKNNTKLLPLKGSKNAGFKKTPKLGGRGLRIPCFTNENNGPVIIFPVYLRVH